MNKIKQTKKLLVIPVVLGTLLWANSASAVVLSDYGLKEGDVISATNDLDVYIVNEHSFKRLFVSPQIFGLYGHLGFDKVKNVSSSARDAFATSGLFRNCESGDQKVYGLEVVSEDVAVLHHVNLTGAEAVAQDPSFFKKVFCINNSEQALYSAGASFNSLSEVPSYSRGGNVSPAPVVNSAVLSVDNTKTQTVTKNASNFTLLKADFKGDGSVEQLKVKRLGFGSGADYGDGVYLYVDGERFADVRSFNSDNFATFNNLHLKSPFTVEVKTDFAGSVGNVAKVQLVGNYNGLPLDSNSFSFAGANSGKIEILPVGSLDSIVVGQKGAQVSEFKASASADESITIKHFELFNGGDAELSNPYIKVDDVKYSGYVSGDKVVFNVNLEVKAGKSETIEVYADVSGDSSDTVKLFVENSYDVVAVGDIYGFGVKVDSTAFNTSAEAHSLVLASNGTLTAELDSSLDPQSVVWGDSGRVVLRFNLESEDESFEIDEVKVEVDSDVVKRVHLYSGSNLLKSVSVNDEDEVVFENLSVVVDGEKEFAVKADFKDEADSTSVSFSAKLTGVSATGTGSGEDVDLSLALTGESVYVYPSVPKLARTDSFGASATLISGVEQEVFSWSVTAVGGDVRLASTSNAFTFNVVDSGLASGSYYDFRVVSGGNDVATGQITYSDNSFSVSFDDDVVINKGQNKEFSLYVDFKDWASSGTRYFRTELKDSNGSVKWQVKDKDDNWSSDKSSVSETLDVLPLKFAQFANSN